MLHPEHEPRVAYVAQCLAEAKGPVIAATDYLKAYSDQIREFVPGRFVSLGTDGFGRSDTRSKLRKFFEVSREYVVVAALKALADEGSIAHKEVTQAIKALGVQPDKADPSTI